MVEKQIQIPKLSQPLGMDNEQEGPTPSESSRWSSRPELIVAADCSAVAREAEIGDEFSGSQSRAGGFTTK